MELLEKFKEMLVKYAGVDEDKVDNAVEIVYFTKGLVPSYISWGNKYENAQFKFYWLYKFPADLVAEAVNYPTKNVEVIIELEDGKSVTCHVLFGNIRVLRHDNDAFMTFSSTEEFKSFIASISKECIQALRKFSSILSVIFIEKDFSFLSFE